MPLLCVDCAFGPPTIAVMIMPNANTSTASGIKIGWRHSTSGGAYPGLQIVKLPSRRASAATLKNEVPKSAILGAPDAVTRMLLGCACASTRCGSCGQHNQRRAGCKRDKLPAGFLLARH